MIRAWMAVGGAAREVDAQEAVRNATEGRGKVWLDIEAEDDSTVTSLLEPLAIHPVVVEDLIQQVNRPKVDNYGDYLYLVVHSARWEGERPTLRELDIVIGTRWLVTYRDASSRACTAAHEVMPRRPELLAEGPAHLLHFVLDVMADQYLPIADQITETIDAVEEGIFRARSQADHVQIIRLKRGLAALRRIVGPQRDTLLALTRDEFKPIPRELRPYLRDVYDRLARVNDLFDSFRDELATVLELHLTMTSNRLNEIIKRLTVIATIGLPLTVITSYYGMNFEFAEYHMAHPHAFVLALIVGSAVGTLWLLKYKNWL